MQFCKTCRWWHTLSDKRGLCRIRAPRGYVAGGAIIGDWPETQPTDWCGEWTAHPPSVSSHSLSLSTD